MSTTLEIVRFNVDPSHVEAFLAGRSAAIEALQSHSSGLLNTRLARVADDVWVDVLEWETREQAAAAAVTAEKLPAVQSWAEHISGFLSFEQANIKHSAC